MSILAFGINHKSAPVAIRERVAFEPEQLPSALQDLTSRPHIQEAAIISTCNRTELYCGLDHQDNALITQWLSDYHQLSIKELEPYIYAHPDQKAVRHALRVASGLDSMVLGEPQILGQMKDAYVTANHAGTLGGLLDRLFQHTFSVAKQVRTDTEIGSSPVSIAFAAVNLAKNIFTNFKDNTALLIGAGETIELAARHLHQSGIGRMIIANRTVERAQKVAKEFNAYAIALPELPSHLAEADIIISSTASPLPILGKGSVESALKIRKHRPMLLVDIAVPRDIESEVADLNDVYLYTVDDMDEIIQDGLRSRQEAAAQAEEIIDTQVTHFMSWVQSLGSVSTIRQVRDIAEFERDQELNEALLQIANGKDPEEVLKRFAHRLTNKLIHQPSTKLKQASYEGRSDLLKAAAELFNLGEPPDKS